MENKKYYTPSIEEFHESFEYQYSNGLKWIEYFFDFNDAEVFEKKIKEGLIRVKYLDREDIESLGWELMSDNNKYWLNSGDENKCVCLFHTGIIVGEIPERWIISDTRDMPFTIRFDGNIKNKSELKRLMQQLNIPIDETAKKA